MADGEMVESSNIFGSLIIFAKAKPSKWHLVEREGDGQRMAGMVAVGRRLNSISLDLARIDIVDEMRASVICRPNA